MTLSEQFKAELAAWNDAKARRVKMRTGILKHIYDRNHELKSRTPEAWAELVNQQPESIRVSVGKVIWWDWFSDRSLVDRWDHLDAIINQPIQDEPTLEELQLILFGMGYPASEAVMRLSSFNEIINYNPKTKYHGTHRKIA